MATQITWDEFVQVDIRVGRIVSARSFKEARKPAYIVEVDFGKELGIRKSSAQLTKHYVPEQLVGELVAAVVNFPVKHIGPIRSEILILGFPDANGEPVLVQPGQEVPLGGKLF